jgi:hypothetical protein
MKNVIPVRELSKQFEGPSVGIQLAPRFTRPLLLHRGADINRAKFHHRSARIAC